MGGGGIPEPHLTGDLRLRRGRKPRLSLAGVNLAADGLERSCAHQSPTSSFLPARALNSAASVCPFRTSAAARSTTSTADKWAPGFSAAGGPARDGVGGVQDAHAERGGPTT
jgi:hypothetical protein